MKNSEGIAVIVLNHNKKNDLLLCLKSIYASDYPNYSLVVVDNNSSDGSADAVAHSYPATPLIRHPENAGVSKGRNVGWYYAKEHFESEYVIFLDDDTEIAPDYFSRIVAAYQQHPEVGIVTGKAYTSLETRTFCSVGISVNLYTGLIYDIGVGRRDEGQYDTACYRAACGGFAFSARRTLFEELGAFDERYSPYGWEDVDFCLKALKAGHRTYYVPAAVVVHKGTKAGRNPVPAYERNKIKNYLFLLKQHTNTPQKLCCCFCIPLKSLYIVYEMIFTGHARVILSQFRGFFEGLLKANR
jgi:GT2 family glycosyltransferase